MSIEAMAKALIVTVILLSSVMAPTFSASQPTPTTPPPHTTSLLDYSNHMFAPWNPRHGHGVVQLGYFWGSQGKAQHVNVQYLDGNQYTVNHQHQDNGLVGLGYYMDALNRAPLRLTYGIDVFYLAGLPVSGTIIQEDSFNNLAYRYQIQNIPLYFATKADVATQSEAYGYTLDVGIGPNFMRTSHYAETPIEGSDALPDNGFAAHNNVAFTAMVGAGVRLNNVFGHTPLECGYRFFYLGQGNLRINNNQLLNNLGTGSVYANAILCSIVG